MDLPHNITQHLLDLSLIEVVLYASFACFTSKTSGDNLLVVTKSMPSISNNRIGNPFYLHLVWLKFGALIYIGYSTRSILFGYSYL